MENGEDKTIRPQDGIIRSDSDENQDNTEKTIRIDNTAPGIPAEEEKTIRSEPDVINADAQPEESIEKTIRGDANIISAGGSSTPQQPKETDGNIAAPASPKTFKLGSDEYKLVKTISEETGEGQIFLIEKDRKSFVLKLYFPNIKPKLPLVKKLKENSNDRVIKTFDFGYNTDNRFYELQEFAEGGTLDKILPIRDVSRIKKIVKDVNEGLSFCHSQGIIHKDLKPANIFIRKTGIDDYILGDFGISSLFDAETKMHMTTQARSEIYAAPEVYLSRDGKTMITPKVDYYSLGLSVIYIWLGKNPFKGMNEMLLPTLKMEGRVKIPEDMPNDLSVMVKGLLTPKYEKRWGYDEIKKWLNGEKVAVFEETVKLQYEPFIFDAEENLIAKTPAELAQIMKENKQTAKRYLYAGKIDQWLNKAKNTKLEVAVLEAYEKIYPKDQDAGLKAAIYILDKNMPYTAIDGTTCSETKDFVDIFFKHFDQYAGLLSNKNDEFYIYLKSKENESLAERYQSFFNKKTDNKTALLNIIYDLDPTAPFRFEYRDDKNVPQVAMLNSPKEVSDYMDTNRDEAKEIIYNGILQNWMQARLEDETIEEELSGNIQNALSWINYINEQYAKNQAAGVSLAVFALDPEAGILSLDNETTLVTKEDIGSDILANIKEYFDILKNENASLFLYMVSKGWEDEINYIKYCMNPDNHNKKMGPYNDWLAAMKIITHLGVEIVYKVNDKSISDPEELLKADSKDKKKLIAELKDFNSTLSDWLCLQFQEKPEHDFSNEEYIYEKKLTELLEFVNKLDPKNEFSKRFEEAKASVPKKIRKEKALDKRFWLIKIFSLSFTVVTAVGLFLLVYFSDGNPFPFAFWEIPSGYYWAFILLPMIIYFVTGGYGDGIEFSTGCIGTPIVGLIASVIVYYIFYFVISYPMVLGGLILLILGYSFYNIYRSESHTNKDVRATLFNSDDDYVFKYEPLAYAFNTDNGFVSSRVDLLDQYHEQRREAKKSFLRYGLMPSILFISCLILFATTDKKYSAYLEEAGISLDKIPSFISFFNPSIPDLEGKWGGKISNKDLLLKVEKQDDLTFQGSVYSERFSPAEFAVTGAIDTADNTITFSDETNGTFTGKLDEEKKTVSGTMRQKNGRRANFNLEYGLAVEIPKAETPVKEEKKPVQKPVVSENKPAETPVENKTEEVTTQTTPPVEDQKSPATTKTDNPAQQPVNEPVKSDESPKLPAPVPVKETPKAAAKPVIGKPQVYNNCTFALNSCRASADGQLIIDFTVTNKTGAGAYIVLANRRMSAIDDRGNLYADPVKVLGGQKVTEPEKDLSYILPVDASVSGSLIFPNLNDKSDLLKEINIWVSVKDFDRVRFKDITIKKN